MNDMSIAGENPLGPRHSAVAAHCPYQDCFIGSCVMLHTHGPPVVPGRAPVVPGLAPVGPGQAPMVPGQALVPPPPISYGNVHNYYGPCAYGSLDKGVAYSRGGGSSGAGPGSSEAGSH